MNNYLETWTIDEVDFKETINEKIHEITKLQNEIGMNQRSLRLKKDNINSLKADLNSSQVKKKVTKLNLNFR